MSFETIRIGLLHPWQAHEALQRVWKAIKPLLATGTRFHLEVRAEKRSDPQNRLMWALLTDLSEQLPWHSVQLSPTDYKTMLTASLRAQRVVPGIDGGFVVLGDRTSQMSKAEMSDLIDLVQAFRRRARGGIWRTTGGGMIYVLLLTWLGYSVPLDAYPTIDECQAAAHAFEVAHPDMPAILYCVGRDGT